MLAWLANVLEAVKNTIGYVSAVLMERECFISHNQSQTIFSGVRHSHDAYEIKNRLDAFIFYLEEVRRQFLNDVQWTIKGSTFSSILRPAMHPLSPYFSMCCIVVR